MFLTIVLLARLTTAAPAPQAPGPLHCRITLGPGANSDTCRVTIPAGKKIRSCDDAARQAGHCDAAGGGRYVAWVMGTGPGRCRITKKKTDWHHRVRAKLSKSAAASSCDLYVEVR